MICESRRRYGPGKQGRHDRHRQHRARVRPFAKERRHHRPAAATLPPWLRPTSPHFDAHRIRLDDGPCARSAAIAFRESAGARNGKRNRVRQRSFSSSPRGLPQSLTTDGRIRTATRIPVVPRCAALDLRRVHGNDSLPRRGSSPPGQVLACALAPSVSGDLWAVAARSRARPDLSGNHRHLLRPVEIPFSIPRGRESKRYGSPRRPRPMRCSTPSAARRANAR